MLISKVPQGDSLVLQMQINTVTLLRLPSGKVEISCTECFSPAFSFLLLPIKGSGGQVLAPGELRAAAIGAAWVRRGTWAHSVRVPPPPGKVTVSCQGYSRHETAEQIRGGQRLLRGKEWALVGRRWRLRKAVLGPSPARCLPAWPAEQHDGVCYPHGASYCLVCQTPWPMSYTSPRSPHLRWWAPHEHLQESLKQGALLWPRCVPVLLLACARMGTHVCSLVPMTLETGNTVPLGTSLGRQFGRVAPRSESPSHPTPPL